MVGIVADTGCDLKHRDEESKGIELVPFKLNIGSREFIDGFDMDVDEFIKTMVASEEVVKTSCPAPYDFLKAYEKFEGQDVFCLTISSKLSGTYQSAQIAKAEFTEKYPDAKIHVFDTKSASAGESCVAHYLKALIQEGLPFEEIVEKTEKYISEMRTFFVLESLDNLQKNGRIKKAVGTILNALKIKPAMWGVDGDIELFKMQRGFKRSLIQIINYMEADDTKGKTLCISHVDALDKAEFIKEKVLEKCEFEKIIITKTLGLSSAYADNGGIVLAY